MTQEISKVRIQEGTSNPWATSSTSVYKVILWSSLTEEEDIEEYIKENYIRSNIQAPIGRSIKIIANIKLSNVKFGECYCASTNSLVRSPCNTKTWLIRFFNYA